jgi:hypothetical protein
MVRGAISIQDEETCVVDIKFSLVYNNDLSSHYDFIPDKTSYVCSHTSSDAVSNISNISW